jgi:hypothetical protein
MNGPESNLHDGFSLHEVGIEVRAVDGSVTAGAITTRLKAQTGVRNIRREWIHVALQAQQTLLAADQQLAIHASVRSVARSAAFYFHGRVLEDKGSAFLCVAVSAGFRSILAKRCEIGASMGVVAIGTLHRAFRHAMMRRQRELSLNVAVASKTQFRLRLLKQTVVEPAILLWELWHGEESGLRDTQIHSLRIPRRLDQMRRVTIHTSDAVLHMVRMVKGRLVPAALMALQTPLRILLGITMEGENEFRGGCGLGVVSVRGFLGIRVRFAWTMT